MNGAVQPHAGPHVAHVARLPGAANPSLEGHPSAEPCASDEEPPSCDERAVDERSPPSVSQRCVHCGMPTRPSRYRPGDPDLEVLPEGASSPKDADAADASLPHKGGTAFVSGRLPEPTAAVPRDPDELRSSGAWRAPPTGVAAWDECCSDAALGSVSRDLPHIVQDTGRGVRGPRGTNACRGTVICVGEVCSGSLLLLDAVACRHALSVDSFSLLP